MKTIGKKVIIIINGKGGSGKDSICKIVAKQYRTEIVSEITPIKNIAKLAGWNGEKDDKSRKMLSDLKMLFVEYNDLPYTYAMEKIRSFLGSADEIMFIHIRERSEIEKLIKAAPIKVFTLLVKRTDESFVQRDYGNFSDDMVDDFKYDFYYVGNNKTKDDLEKSFISFFDTEVLPAIIRES